MPEYDSLEKDNFHSSLFKKGRPWYVTALVGIGKVNSVKKLVPNTLQFTYQNLRSCKSQVKNEKKNIELLVFSFSPINLVF